MEVEIHLSDTNFNTAFSFLYFKGLLFAKNLRYVSFLIPFVIFGYLQFPFWTKSTMHLHVYVLICNCFS